jgi:hypothetical protein
MKMVYAESWMIDALKAAHLPPTALLDIPVLLDTLSPVDVAFYLAMNRSLTEFLPKDLVMSFSPLDVRLEQLGEHTKKQKLVDALHRREFAKGAVPKLASDSDYKLTCDLLDADTLVFQHIRKSDPSLSAMYYDLTFVERVLRQMYTAISFEKLVVLPITRWWMEMRAKALVPNKVV